MCVSAPTGSGKTLAFGLPLMQFSGKARPVRPKALILVPTRELAAQVCKVLGDVGAVWRQSAVAIYGGSGYDRQLKQLRRGVHVIVACPGRLEDLVDRREVDLSVIDKVVIDEADRMADMGFLPAVRRIVEQTSSKRQLLLFSATMGKEVEQIVKSYQNNPTRLNIVPDTEAIADVEHLFWKTESAQKIHLTTQVVSRNGKTVIFCRTKRGADRVAHQLQINGVEAVAIHGDRSQSQRERALAAFSSGKYEALVATDVVARGIHVQGLDCVIHFDPAMDVTDYVHRSGRTGRAGSSGTVISLVTHEHRSAQRVIQKSLGLKEGLDSPTVDGPDNMPEKAHKQAESPSSHKVQLQSGPRPKGFNSRSRSGKTFRGSENKYSSSSRLSGDGVSTHEGRDRADARKRRTKVGSLQSGNPLAGRSELPSGRSRHSKAGQVASSAGFSRKGTSSDRAR